MPREGRAREPWELREVLLDRSEMESPPTGVREPSPEWRFITEDSWGRGGEEGEENKEEQRGRGQGVEEDVSFSLLARLYRTRLHVPAI